MEALGIDSHLLLAQMINFIIFFILFKKFMAKPLIEFIKKQHSVEREKERLAQKALADEEKNAAKVEEILKKARQEAAEIIADAKITAKKVNDELLKKAHDDVVSLKAKASLQLENDKKELMAQQHDAVVRASSALVKTVLADVLDKKSQEQIMDAFLKKAKSVN